MKFSFLFLSLNICPPAHAGCTIRQAGFSLLPQQEGSLGPGSSPSLPGCSPAACEVMSEHGVREKFAHTPSSNCASIGVLKISSLLFYKRPRRSLLVSLVLPCPSSSLFPQVEGKHGAVKRLQITSSLGYV